MMNNEEENENAMQGCFNAFIGVVLLAGIVSFGVLVFIQALG